VCSFGAAAAHAQDPSEPSTTQSVAASISDPASAREIRIVVFGLVALGVVLVVITAWMWVTTRPEPAALGRLELMAGSNWARADRQRRLALLDGVRPRMPEDAGRLPADPVAVVAGEVAATAGPAGGSVDDVDESWAVSADAEPVAERRGLEGAALHLAAPSSPSAPLGGTIHGDG
jgi:hypothetical protein